MNQLRLPRWANVTSLGHSPELHCKWSESTSLSQSENFTNTKLNKLKSKQKCSFIANEHFFYPKIQDKQKNESPINRALIHEHHPQMHPQYFSFVAITVLINIVIKRTTNIHPAIKTLIFPTPWSSYITFDSSAEETIILVLKRLSSSPDIL